MEGCGQAGHSATAKIWVDGDGSGRLGVKGIKDRKAVGEWLEKHLRDKDPELSVSLD